jgi:hypothetical protein
MRPDRGCRGLCLTFALLVPGFVFGQVDFTGEWAPIYHEDAPERGPGAELGDYLELPINIGIFGCAYAAEVPRPEGTAPHHLPGENPNLRDFAAGYGPPFEASRSGAETPYPESRLQLRDYEPPAACERFCNCTSLFNCR